MPISFFLPISEPFFLAWLAGAAADEKEKKWDRVGSRMRKGTLPPKERLSFAFPSNQHRNFISLASRSPSIRHTKKWERTESKNRARGEDDAKKKPTAVDAEKKGEKERKRRRRSRLRRKKGGKSGKGM